MNSLNTTNKNRYKKALGSNSQVAHVWANQSQGSGYTKNMFFSGTRIYSYGTHFLAGEIHEINGVKFALVNSRKYSVSTSGHLAEVRSSLLGLMPYFQVPNPSNPFDSQNIEAVENELFSRIDSIFSRSLIKYRDSIDWQLKLFDETLKETNQFLKLIGKKEISIPSDFRKELKDYLEYRFIKYQESQTPEALEIAKQKAEKQKIYEQKRQENAVEKWVDTGDHSLIKYLKNIPYDVIRVKTEPNFSQSKTDFKVVTQRGAEVPLFHAKILLNALLTGKNVEGKRIGHFTVNYVRDGIVKIGCHRINIEQAKLAIEKGV